MTYTWTKQLSIGNRIIDSTHKEALGIINNIVRSIAARDVAALLEAFELLENGLRAYFVVEKNIAQAVNFDFNQHELAHLHLLNKLHCVKDELTDKSGLWSDDEVENYSHSLWNCLIQHIKKDSQPLKIVLDTHFYDFNPDCGGGATM